MKLNNNYGKQGKEEVSRFHLFFIIQHLLTETAVIFHAEIPFFHSRI